MNFADLYADAVCCLLQCSVAIGIVATMFCRGKIEPAGKTFPMWIFAAALSVGIVISAIMLVGNPNYLAYLLWFFTFLLAVAGLVTRRFRMQKYGTVFVTVGTVMLYLFFRSLLITNGYVSRQDGSQRARLIYFESILQEAAQSDKNLYPAGTLTDRHPVLLAHANLADTINKLKRISLWHSFFTDLYKLAPLSPFEFQAGTIADNQEALLAHARRASPGVPLPSGSFEGNLTSRSYA